MVSIAMEEGSIVLDQIVPSEIGERHVPELAKDEHRAEGEEQRERGGEAIPLLERADELECTDVLPIAGQVAVVGEGVERGAG